MSFSSASETAVNARFMLVKLTPAKYLNAGITSLGSNVYQFTAPSNLTSVQHNGVAMTEVGTLGTTQDTYTYNPTTGVVQFYSANAPSSTHIYVAFFAIYVTGEETRIIGKDPETPETSPVEWQPRLQSYPVIKQSVKNNISGVFTVQDSQLRLINTDNYLQQFLGPEYTFNQKTAEIWLCIDSVDNIRKIYEGKISRINISGATANITIYDSLSKLSTPCYMGDTVSECYFTADDFPNTTPSDLGLPVPYILGRNSRFEMERKNRTSMDTNIFWGYIPEKTNRAICTSYSASATTSNNRTWGLCRVGPSGVQLNVHPPRVDATVQNLAFVDIDLVGTHRWTVRYLVFDSFLSTKQYFKPLDTVKLNQGGTDYYGVVTWVEGSVSGTLEVEIRFEDATFDPSIVDLTPDLTFYHGMSLTIVDTTTGESFFPLENRDYTLNQTTTSGGNKYVSVTFANNFEANLVSMETRTAMATLTPDRHKVYYQVSTATEGVDSKHGTVLQAMCEDVGLEVDAASFTAANTALDIRVMCSIPYFDQADYGNYRDYVEDILKSTLGYLRLNENLEVEYSLFGSPTTGETYDETYTLADSLFIDVDYNDIETQIIAYNSHDSGYSKADESARTDVPEWDSATRLSSQTAENLKAVHLNGISKTTRFRHVLDDFSDLIQDHIDIKSYRRAFYRFKTAVKAAAEEIGNSLTLENSKVLGGTGSQDLLVVAVDKSTESITIEATDVKE
jgi:hypothetical protein